MQLRTRRRGDRVPLLIGIAAGLAGAINVLSALTPEIHGRLEWTHDLVSREVSVAAHALALPAGLSLFVMAFYLARRRRRAVRFALVVLVALGALNLVKGLDWEEALVSWGVAGLLWWGRDAFYAVHSDGRL